MKVKITFDSLNVIDGVKDNFSLRVSLDEDVFNVHVVNSVPPKDILNQKADIIVSSASGAIASFPDGAALPIVDLIAAINPIQDLHGYDSPWPAGGGKNLWPEYETQELNSVTITNDHGKVTINGTASADTYFDINTSISVAANEHVYIYGFNPSASSSNRLTLFVITSSGNPQANLNNANASTDDVDPSARTITKLRFRVPSGVQYTNFVLYPYLQIGGTAPTSWTPYSNLCPISGRTGVEVYRTGKNLLDTSSFTSGTYNDVTLTRNADGSIALSGTASATVNMDSSTFTLPAGTYTLSGSITNNQLYLRDSSTNTTLVESVSGNVHNFTISESKTVYLRLRVGGSSTVSGTVKPQLELGSTDTTYEPYAGSTYSFDWTSPAGTVYSCTIDLVTGVLTVTHKGITFSAISGRASNGIFYLEIDGDYQRDNNPVPLCNIFKGVRPVANTTAMASEDDGTIAVQYNVSYNRLFIKYTAMTTEAAMNTWLSFNPVTFVYELKTPITYQFTPQDIVTLLGSNNIWSDSGDVSVQYRADTKMYIDNKIAQAIAAALNA